MKSKFLKSLCLVWAAAFTFASCEGIGGGTSGNTGGSTGEHTHTYATTWSTNETHHWHAATCEHGENKGSNGEHVDVDEDGKCDTCAYEVGHTHTFEEDWTTDSEYHWKKATCTHTEEAGEKSLHADEDIDGECDACGTHVHTANEYGFCSICDEATKEIQESDMGSIVSAIVGRRKKIVSGVVDYKYSGVNRTDNTIDKMEHIVEYSLGTNGTYMKRSYVNSEDKEETQEDWVEALKDGDAKGITVIKEKNDTTNAFEIINAQPSSFNGDSLLGYFYAVSTLANGHGAESVLEALYDESQNEETVLEFNATHDAENKKYTFTFKSMFVNALKIAQGEKENEYIYNVNYYEADVSFTYNDDYALTSLNIECDRYTNDPGSKDGSGGLVLMEADVDLDYDPLTREITFRETAAADTYTYKVTQVAGTRGEIEINDGAEFAPTDFEVEKDGAKVENLSLNLGQFTELDIVATPVDSYLAFITNDLQHTVTDKNGNVVKGLNVNLHGSNILQLNPSLAGEYVVVLTYRNIEKKINVTVEGKTLGGTHTFEIAAIETNNNYFNQLYTFTATKNGTYTFYLPYGVAVVPYTNINSDGEPIFDDSDIIFDYDNPKAGQVEGEVSFSVMLEAGDKYKLGFKFRDKITYTIGYDMP